MIKGSLLFSLRRAMIIPIPLRKMEEGMCKRYIWRLDKFKSQPSPSKTPDRTCNIFSISFQNARYQIQTWTMTVRRNHFSRSKWIIHLAINRFSGHSHRDGSISSFHPRYKGWEHFRFWRECRYFGKYIWIWPSNKARWSELSQKKDQGGIVVEGHGVIG